MKTSLNLVSLFSCGGIGDYGYVKAGFKPLILTDIDPRRLSFARNLVNPDNVIQGDILSVKDVIVTSIKSLVGADDFAISLTPPCQGMSKNGAHTLKNSIEKGLRDEVDPRNYLIIPSIEIIKETKPSLVLLENVPEIFSTYILVNGAVVSVAEFFITSMKDLGYSGKILQINTADYGIPQSRRRAVGVFCFETLDLDFIFGDKPPTVSLRDAIGRFPHLDAGEKVASEAISFHPLHKVPVMRRDLYQWVRYTPEGSSALENNSCMNCGHKNENKNLYCSECKVRLFKPFVVRNGEARVIKGYNSTYRRQRWDRPANTVTTRSAFASSSYNLHPDQNRVLSIYECAVLQGLDPKLVNWVESSTGSLYPDYFLRDIIGEAIPASFTKLIGGRILTALANKTSHQ